CPQGSGLGAVEGADGRHRWRPRQRAPCTPRWTGAGEAAPSCTGRRPSPESSRPSAGPRRILRRAFHHLPPVWGYAQYPGLPERPLPPARQPPVPLRQEITRLAHTDYPLAQPAKRSRQCSPNLSAVFLTEQSHIREVRDVGRLVLDPVLAGAAGYLPRSLESPARTRQTPSGSAPEDPKGALARRI